MNEYIRILVADDHPVVRQGLAALLIPRNGMKIVGEATNGREAVDLARQLQPDVIIMDLVMPFLNGSEATALIMEQNPQAHILILTSFGEKDSLVQAIRAGAAGCLLKDSAPDELLQAIRSVHRGQLAIPQNLATKLFNPPPARESPESALSNREQEIAALVADGLTNKAIGSRLDISANTVRSHISSILRKLQLANRTQLAIYLRDNTDKP